nr:hypothetical protein [Microvirga guangxiensis]
MPDFIPLLRYLETWSSFRLPLLW